MKLSEELSWRGFVNQTTYEDVATLDGGPIAFYLGVDPSADSMTVGNLAVMMLVRLLATHGHRPYLLIGGATGLIGDPDGKKQEINLKTREVVEANKRAIAGQYSRVLGGIDFELVDNFDWFKDINFLDFLRDIGKHVPLRQMLGREFVSSRLDTTGISYAEFSYVLIQAYDFLHLNREFGVSLQVCGADQWGNCIAGVDLIRRLDSREANVWSIPLVVNKTTGVKFGKSEDGAVWLDPKKTSPFKFYQFWLNLDDEGAVDYLKLYTVLDKPKIDQIEAEFKSNPGARLAQKTLAYEVTKLVHGEASAKSCAAASEVLFGKADFRALPADDVAVLKTELKSVNAARDLPTLLVESDLASSLSEARRSIKSGAVKLNGQKQSDETLQLAPGDNLLKYGKNSFVIVNN